MKSYSMKEAIQLLKKDPTLCMVRYKSKVGCCNGNYFWSEGRLQEKYNYGWYDGDYYRWHWKNAEFTLDELEKRFKVGKWLGDCEYGPKSEGDDE